MPDKKSVTMDECWENIRTYIKKPENIELIEKAWQFAQKAHKDQFRKSGEPYTIHVIQVANILASLHCSPTVIAAGLLHDTIEDCEWVTHQMLEEKFSAQIANLVESVTKINTMKHEFKNEEEYQAHNHRKIFMAMVADIRVVLIKLADRLHNMRTLQYQSPAKQKKIAQETLSVYAPLAHRLGISPIKTELEDLSFKYLEPEEYQKIKTLVANREESRKAQIEEMMKDIETILDHFSIPYRIFGRSKHFYSIYKKMKTKNKQFEEILDMQAIRIVTDTVTHCYEILGYIHATYRPMPGRFKDYIAMPKNNGYQSLHTTVVDPSSGNIFEIQIRTEEMDVVAEKGVAAHWVYKEKNGKNYDDHQPKRLEDKLSWFRDFAIITDEDSQDPLEYTLAIQKDIFEANVCCFTPNGDMIDLPAGSTPIDFAYRVHTEVGHHAVGALVNNVMVPINTILKTGDIVTIKTSKLSPGPSRDWLNIVQSPHARSKIRQFFQKKDQMERKEASKIGQGLLETELKNAGYDPHLLKQNPKRLEATLVGMPYRSLEDLVVAIGSKQISASTVVARLVAAESLVDSSQNDEVLKNFTPAQPRKVAACGISVAGIDSIKVALSPCCMPIPGDEVIGYITKGKGIKVHRKDCPNVQNKDRLIEVEWADNLENRTYSARLAIESTDRQGLVADLLTVFQQNKVGLTAINSKAIERSVSALTTVTVEVTNTEQLDRLIANLYKVNEITNITRKTL